MKRQAVYTVCVILELFRVSRGIHECRGFDKAQFRYDKIHSNISEHAVVILFVDQFLQNGHQTRTTLFFKIVPSIFVALMNGQ